MAFVYRSIVRVPFVKNNNNILSTTFFTRVHQHQHHQRLLLRTDRNNQYLWKERRQLFSSTCLRMSSYNDIVISLKDAISLHGNENVIFVDGSWHLDKSISALKDYTTGPRISGATFLDIDGLNPHESLPHMMPHYTTLQQFAQDTNIIIPPTRTSLSKERIVIVYGTKDAGKFTARAWYTLYCFASIFNKKQNNNDLIIVKWMQGSLKDWQDQGGPIDTESIKSWSMTSSDEEDETKFPQMVTKQQVLNVIDGNDGIVQLVDARSEARFRAEAPEPRPGLRLGHMPGAINVPFTDCLMATNDNLKPVEELKQVFTQKNIDVTSNNPVYVSCGSGVTASTVALALIACGRDPESVHVYDGSWIEWGGDPNTPIV